MENLKIKYLKTIQDSYNKGMITKKEWKRERKSVRTLTKTENI